MGWGGSETDDNWADSPFTKIADVFLVGFTLYKLMGVLKHGSFNTQSI